MYAVTFDIDTNCLADNNITNSTMYGSIRKFLEKRNFKWQQGSVYFGDETINAVTCVTTIQELAKAHPEFATCVKDVRMLKIEEFNDLMPFYHLCLLNFLYCL